MSDGPRIPPLPPDEWGGDVKPVLEAVPAGIERRLGDNNIFPTFARHPELFRAWLPFGGFLLDGGKLRGATASCSSSGRRSAAGSSYEWGQHVRISLDGGIEREAIDRVLEGPDAEGWTPHEAALLRAADELHDDSRISDEHLGDARGDLRRGAADGGDDGRRPLPPGRLCPEHASGWSSTRASRRFPSSALKASAREAGLRRGRGPELAAPGLRVPRGARQPRGASWTTSWSTGSSRARRGASGQRPTSGSRPRSRRTGPTSRSSRRIRPAAGRGDDRRAEAASGAPGAPTCSSRCPTAAPGSASSSSSSSAAGERLMVLINRAYVSGSTARRCRRLAERLATL